MAVGHSILVIFYHMVKSGEPYNEPENGNHVELSAQKNWVESSTQWPSAQYFRSIIQPNYQYEATGSLAQRTD